MSNEMQFSDNVRHLRFKDKNIYIVGTAHISRKSVEEVKHVIDTLKPDTVCVELDALRYETLIDQQRFRKLDLFQIIKEKKVLFVMANLVLSAYQRRLGELLGVKPGAELLAATEKAKEHGAKLVLADREIQATLKRTWHNLSFLNKFRLISVMMSAFFSAKEISEDQIEELKDRDTLSEAMKEFAKAMPQIQIPLIDERDRYLMSSIQEAPGPTIVAVVGAGHVEGMVGYLGQNVDRQALTVIPPTSPWTKLLKWIIPAIVLGAFVFGYQKHSGETLDAMLYAWILPNAVAAALLSIIAGAKLWTVITAFISSPITSLNPTIGTGMVAGFVEAKLRRPTVEDAEGIQDAMMSVRGMYKNRFTRVLLVAIMASIGSSLGAWIGASWVISLL